MAQDVLQTTSNAMSSSRPVQDEAQMIVDHFTREFAAIWQLVREKQTKKSGDKVADARSEVASFGDIAQKLVVWVDQVMQTPSQELKLAAKMELLLRFGDKFYHAQECRAALTFFYANVLVLDQTMDQSEATESVLDHIRVSTGTSSRHRSRFHGQAYIRALFGVAMCCFEAQKRSDPFVRYPQSLEKLLEALTFLRLGMETALAMERQLPGQFSWLTLNGSVLIYSIANPLQSLGFSKQVVTYLKWSLLAMEATVTLSTTKYIMWRLQIGAAVCDCYQDLAFNETKKAKQHTTSALACAAYLQQIVQRLRKEEKLDMPLPVEVEQTLTRAETTSNMLMLRVKATAAYEPLTKSTIETAFPNVNNQIRAAFDVLETLSRQDQRKLCKRTATPLSSSTNEMQLKLLDFIMEIATPMLKSLVEDHELSSRTEVLALDRSHFPMSLHLMSIRHCFQAAKRDSQLHLLIKSARVRLNSESEGLSAADRVLILSLLELYEALDETRYSWLTQDNHVAREHLQSKFEPHLHLPRTDKTLPGSKTLTRMSKAMQNCVFHGNGAICRTYHDLMTWVALQMWHEHALVVLNELDVLEPSQLPEPLVHVACELLQAIHLILTAVEFDDVLLHGRICLRLATLLAARREARTGAQIVRRCLDRINSRRSEFVAFSLHVDAVNAATECTASLSNASFSCAIDSQSGVATAKAQDHVDVPDTRSQLGSLRQDLACVQVDLLLLLYRLELQDAAMVDTLPSSSTKAATTSTSASCEPNTVLSDTEATLLDECHQNGYAKALLYIERLARPHTSIKERRSLADKSLELLQHMEMQEEKLRRQLTTRCAEKLTTIPAAPLVISRSSSAITVQVVEFQPSQSSLRAKRVKYYMVFAKAAGVGTSVSLTNNHLAGTAAPVYPPALHVTISDLLPNETYVFAVAAFDSKHQLITSIGKTSEPVSALNPLPLSLCYGYLAQACYKAQLVARAQRAANYLYNAVVSHEVTERPSWMANPFYRQALKHDAVAQLPIPILKLCIQALLVLCHEETGDLERDGMLVTSSDVEAQSLTATQTKALEDSRKMSMAIEIACAIDNHEAIRVLSFKGYRLLLPLLHLKGSCEGLTFAALVTFYQALGLIPLDKRDVDTQNIRARVGFELFRIAQATNTHVSHIRLPFVLPTSHEPAQTPSNHEDDSLREVIALFQMTSNSFTTCKASDAEVKGVAAAVSKGKAPSNTPLSTTDEQDQPKAKERWQSLCELLQAAGNDLPEVFSILEHESVCDLRRIEAASKVCGAVLRAGIHDVSHMDKFLSSFTVAGVGSSQFRATLASIGGGSLLSERTDVDEEHALNAPSDDGRTASEAKVEADDVSLYRWCGELFFIQSVLLHRKISKLCDAVQTVDTANGPDNDDCTYDLLHNDSDQDTIKSTKSTETLALALDTKSHEGATTDNVAQEAGLPETSADTIEENPLSELISELLQKSAGCCTLFRLSNCWQGLQAVTQQLWNTIWQAWIPPSQMTTPLTRLPHLSICVDALLDMMDLTVHGGTLATSFNVSFEHSMVRSNMVHTATNALNLDQTWFAKFMVYSIRVFCACKDWHSIVQKGARYHLLCGNSAEGSRFSEQHFPVLIYAQQQIVNHQERLVTRAEEELNVVVVAFQEQDAIARKKKRKTRLVVEEILSPEEIAFRTTKKEMEQGIQNLVAVRTNERHKLATLSSIYDGLCKASSQSQQALDTCHALVKKYRRLGQRLADGRDKLQREIISCYTRCVTLSRQKRQRRIVCQALHEAGDFHLACGHWKAAVKCWLESLDNAFSVLNVSSSWRQVVAPCADHFLSGSNKDPIGNDELWVGLQCCSVLSKLIMHSSGTTLHRAIDYALMAAAIFTRFYACSVPHPTKSFLFGTYRILGQFWPGRELLVDPDRVFPFSLGMMFGFVPEVLLQYEHQYASTAMPIIAGYEYVAESCLQDVHHVANAQRLRLEALIQCGRFHEAFQVLAHVLHSTAIPRSSSKASELDAVDFHDGKPISDEANRAALNWLLSFNAEQIHIDLKQTYHETLVVHILAAILHLGVALSRHESRFDGEVAIARTAAKKMAQTLLILIKPSEGTTFPLHTSRDVADKDDNEDATTHPALQSIAWEELLLHQVRADVQLQLSYLAFDEGNWDSSRGSSMDAIKEYDAIPLIPEQVLHLELDQKLTVSLAHFRGTFVAKCRSQAIACYLAQNRFHAAFKAAQLAVNEAKITGEEHFRQRLEFQRLQAAVFLGQRESAERGLFALREDALATHTSGSLTYVQTLQALSSLLRSKALLSSQSSALNAVYERLSEAEEVLNVLLERDGWIGLASEDHASALQQFEKRLNLYHPAIPVFVQVHADLAHVLLECPLHDENAHARQDKALRSVERGIRALDHTSHQMSGIKARLLLLRGILLSRSLSSTAAQLAANTSSVPSLDNVQLHQQVEQCVDALTGSIRSSIQGTYDRQLVRSALIELVSLFGQKLIPHHEDAHVEAAFHYLNLALEVQRHESVLFDTLELQNGTVTSVEQLPASIRASVSAQFDEHATVPSQTLSQAPDVATIINFFVRLLRMQHILPTCTAALDDTCAFLHSFLVHNHSTYSRVVLTSLPPVPTSSPEIRPGLVCALWGQDHAPAIASASEATSHHTKLTFYFALGSTNGSMTEGSSSASSAAAVARMEKFASSPLVSKHCNIERQSVEHLKTALSSLRAQMEDEESLLIDRDTFPKTLHLTLCEIQQLFRGPRKDTLSTSAKETASQDTSSSLKDAFEKTIALECTLRLVGRLEDLLSINKGVNVVDNELCYFLRDLFD